MDTIMRPPKVLSMALLMCAVILTLPAAVSCGDDDDAKTETVEAGALMIIEPFARVVMDGGAAYFIIENTGDEDDALVDASSDVAGKVGLHETVTEGAMMMMRAVEEISIPAGGEAILEPGGYHVMLTELREELEEGDSFDVTLTFQEAGSVEVEVAVTPFAVSDERADDPYNPSYRVVTAQVLSIESDLGMRGGLGALLRGAEPVWHMAAMRVMEIEGAWTEVRLELERRAEHQPGAESAMGSFEESLGRMRADIAAEEASGASRSLSELSGSLDVKDVLHEADVDGRRLAIVVSAFVAVWIVLIVGSLLVANWRDPRFMRARRKAR
jgi:copper(I)-binding protein